MPSREELIERLDDQSRRYQSVILTLPEWADIRARLHPAPTAADTPAKTAYDILGDQRIGVSAPTAADKAYDPTTQPYDEPFRHAAADTGGLVERLKTAAYEWPTAEVTTDKAKLLTAAAARLTVVERELDALIQISASWSASLASVERERDEALALNAADAGLVERLTAELAAVSQAIGSVEWMDPPDGGSVTLAEQVERMRLALAAAREQISTLEAALAEANDTPAWDALKICRTKLKAAEQREATANFALEELRRELRKETARRRKSEQREAAAREQIALSDKHAVKLEALLEPYVSWDGKPSAFEAAREQIALMAGDKQSLIADLDLEIATRRAAEAKVVELQGSIDALDAQRLELYHNCVASDKAASASLSSAREQIGAMREAIEFAHAHGFEWPSDPLPLPEGGQ